METLQADDRAEVDTTPDIVVEVDGPMGTVVLLHGATDAGQAWLDERIGEDAQRWAGRVVCERRYVADVVDGARRDGLWVDVEGRAS